MNRASDRPDPPSYLFSRFIFFRLLGLVCLIAHLSLWSQIIGLIGEAGILPVGEYLDQVSDAWPGRAHLVVPTLFWLNASDTALHVACAAGTVLSLSLIAGLAHRLTILLLWINYLSLFQASQIFLGFQWDTLLLETLLFSWFIAPPGWRMGQGHAAPVSPIGRWAMWWLLLKLMFLSGITKLLSGDESWRDLTAMNYHYFTQPLPNAISWYFYQQPEWFHRFSTVGMYVAELGAPLLILAPRRLRHAGALFMFVLQLMIGLTGNYGFFNLLTCALCILLLDDQLIQRILGPNLFFHQTRSKPQQGFWSRGLVCGALILLLLLSGLKFMSEMTYTQNARQNPRWVTAAQNYANDYLMAWVAEQVFRRTDRFASVNGYGLFRVMTTTRPELVIELSASGVEWQELSFRYKPGDVQRRPGFVAPHMPRLDWQMWFAALEVPGSDRWLRAFFVRLLQKSPPVWNLLGEEIGEREIRFVRVTRYRYEFTSRAQRNRDGAWWRRQLLFRSPALDVDDLIR